MIISYVCIVCIVFTKINIKKWNMQKKKSFLKDDSISYFQFNIFSLLLIYACICTHNKRMNGINRHRLGNKKFILYEDYRRNTGTKNENDVAFLRNKQQKRNNDDCECWMMMRQNNKKKRKIERGMCAMSRYLLAISLFISCIILRSFLSLKYN